MNKTAATLIVAAGAVAGAVLARLQPSPAAVTRSITTYTEHDIAHINATPATIEPSAYFSQMATHNAGLYVAYLRTGAFTRDEAFEVFCMQMEASLYGGKR